METCTLSSNSYRRSPLEWYVERVNLEIGTAIAIAMRLLNEFLLARSPGRCTVVHKTSCESPVSALPCMAQVDEDDFNANPGLVNAFRLAQLQTQYVLHCSQVIGCVSSGR